jgi:hypothetical protein
VEDGYSGFIGGSMPDLKDAFAKLRDSIARSEKQGHAAIVVRLTSILEYDLERSIKRKFRSLNKDKRNRLFEGYGPLSSFAAKIDLAYALDITTDAIDKELTLMRRIRNKFAHSKERLTLDEEPIKTLFYELKRSPGATGSYVQQFVHCGAVLDDYLEAFLFRMGEREDLRIIDGKPLDVVEDVK